jgi:hypothetical protein
MGSFVFPSRAAKEIGVSPQYFHVLALRLGLHPIEVGSRIAFSTDDVERARGAVRPRTVGRPRKNAR